MLAHTSFINDGYSTTVLTDNVCQITISTFHQKAK